MSSTNFTPDPTYRVPQAPPTRWTAEEMLNFVKTGMRVELSTIPLYLFSQYSIIPDNGGMGTQARATIRSVVEQEMLHLALGGNLLTALDGFLALYDYAIVPQYPSEILYENIPMSLQFAGKDNLDCFLRIESPYTPRPKFEPGEEDFDGETHLERRLRANIAPTYRSIGQFYDDLGDGLKELPDSDFAHNPDKQFGSSLFFGSQMIVVKDQRSALDALKIIIDQGEGSVGVPDSHYTIFVDLYSKRKLWTCYNVPKDPQTSGYSSNTFLYKLSLAFDASYCYLLQTIQRIWQTGNDQILVRVHLLRNLRSIMSNLNSPIADILVQQPFNGGVAAPCFNFYPPTTGTTDQPQPLSPDALFSKLTEEINAALAVCPAAVKPALTRIADSLRTTTPNPLSTE